MKATIQSTDQIVPVNAPSEDGMGRAVLARVWEGVTEGGVPFTAYIPVVQVRRTDNNSQFERELSEHKKPEPDTQRAIDLRFVL